MLTVQIQASFIVTCIKLYQAVQLKMYINVHVNMEDYS